MTINVNKTIQQVASNTAEQSVSIQKENNIVEVSNNQNRVVVEVRQQNVVVNNPGTVVVTNRQVQQVVESRYMILQSASRINIIDAGDYYESGNVEDALQEVAADLDGHIADLSNPHVVTKAQVGLGNVDNTSDLNKPISTATQAALDLKYDASNPAGYITSTALTPYAKLDATNQPFTAPITVTNYLKQDANGNNIFGYLAGVSLTTGLDNFLSGTQAGTAITEASYNWIGGYRAGQMLTTGDNNFLGGYYAGNSLVDGASNIYCGSGAGQFNVSGISNVAIGTNAQQYNLTNYNVAIGNSACRYFTGGNIVAIGYFASTGVLGSSSGSQVVAIGTQTNFSNTTGIRIVAIGYRAHYLGVGSNNVCVGDNSGNGGSGANFSRCTYLGTWTAQNATTGGDNVNIGFASGYQPAAVTANASTTASKCTFVGAYSGLGSTTQRTNATAIGYYAVVDNDNMAVIGGTGANAQSLRNYGGRVRSGILAAARTTNMTLAIRDYIIPVDTSGGNVTITLPASPIAGQEHIVIHKTQGNTLTVSGNGANIIDEFGSNASVAFTNYVARTYIYDGAAWLTI